jgi:hypothetical protein
VIELFPPTSASSFHPRPFFVVTLPPQAVASTSFCLRTTGFLRAAFPPINRRCDSCSSPHRNQPQHTPRQILMSYDLSTSPSPYRPYVVPLDPSPSILSPSSTRNKSSSARDLLADLDLPTEYLDNPELGDLVSSVLTSTLTKYVSVFLRQPFEIVKTTMQVQYLPRGLPQLAFPSKRHPTPVESDEDLDDVPYLPPLPHPWLSIFGLFWGFRGQLRLTGGLFRRLRSQRMSYRCFLAGMRTC